MKMLVRLKRRSLTSLFPAVGMLVMLSLGAFLWGLTSRVSFYPSRLDDPQQLFGQIRAIEVKRELPKEKTGADTLGESQLLSDQLPEVDDVQPKGGQVKTDAGKTETKQKETGPGGPIYVPPPDDRPIRRFPQCVIIGFGKCGTRALLTFMALHPYIAAQTNEMHFYNVESLFEKGYKWYLEQMPFSYSNQITIEKSPDYVLSAKALKEIHQHFPKVKLISLVRNPVDRLVSSYLQRHRFVAENERGPITMMYINRTTHKFDPTINAVDVGVYHKHLSPWFQTFPRDQILILGDEQLTKDPLSVLVKVESFLGLPHLLTKENFYLNETWGFYCFKRFEANASPKCITKFKGWKHPDLPPADEKMLYDFYRPHNQKLFDLIGQKFDWEKKEGGDAID
ncbi:heparan sulfate glucosamine 3-O-sulfotransferase 1-like [Physella acuta]|uniref:heparan sulfate glucosamine 3-O-sulfotransferase 1-like n=1 Tax=Physella acuta TaxID=109671 RepID=UPI0027DCC0BE|nr:heparan sulfate glucosamine 3-O-sulfotransferase 1-like [Physella acuta]